MDQQRRFLLAGAAASALLPSARVLAASPDRMRLFAGLVPSVSQPGGVLESRALSAVPGGVGDTVEWMPWARAFATAQLGNAYLFPLVRTREREADWHWLAPLAHDRLVAVTAKPQSLLSLTGLRIGAIRSTFVLAKLTKLGLSGVELAPSEQSNAAKLGRGRIDAWVTIERVADAAEHQALLPRKTYRLPLDERPFTMWLVATRGATPSPGKASSA
jgi:hypothetical protein